MRLEDSPPVGVVSAPDHQAAAGGVEGRQLAHSFREGMRGQVVGEAGFWRQRGAQGEVFIAASARRPGEGFSGADGDQAGPGRLRAGET
jgi:hypothetical protein